MWLMAPGTALWLVGAFAGALILLAVTGLPALVSIVVGAVAGGTAASLLLGGAADRANEWLRTPKLPSRER